jgi:hypothetical protein
MIGDHLILLCRGTLGKKIGFGKKIPFGRIPGDMPPSQEFSIPDDAGESLAGAKA